MWEVEDKGTDERSVSNENAQTEASYKNLAEVKSSNEISSDTNNNDNMQSISKEKVIEFGGSNPTGGGTKEDTSAEENQKHSKETATKTTNEKNSAEASWREEPNDNEQGEDYRLDNNIEEEQDSGYSKERRHTKTPFKDNSTKEKKRMKKRTKKERTKVFIGITN